MCEHYETKFKELMRQYTLNMDHYFEHAEASQLRSLEIAKRLEQREKELERMMDQQDALNKQGWKFLDALRSLYRKTA